MQSQIIFAPVLIVSVILFLFLIKTRRRAKVAECERNNLKVRFSSVISVEEETAKVAAQKDDLLRDLENLRNSYADKRKIYDRLKSEVAIFDEKIAFAEMGVYEPHFDFGDSESFKNAIREVREEQKEMVKAKTAVTCKVEWTMDGSRTQGKTMANRSIRLALRAFNNECDAAISNVRWNNVNAMEKRIENAVKQIDKLNQSHQIVIENKYLSLKINELFLTHEYREKRKREREERTEEARRIREEKKLLIDAENAQKEEEKYHRMLEKARAEVSGKNEKEVTQMQNRIASLKSKLAKAHELNERARSMAEKTRSGYIYIISNIGSFGADMVKIGLTRRLNPDDRVRELGDASVPFRFDTHAIIYSDDAPSLEHALHDEFNDCRVNTSNLRKEFFKVGLDDVEDAVRRLAPKASFFKNQEAQEYYETIERREQEAENTASEIKSEFPLEI